MSRASHYSAVVELALSAALFVAPAPASAGTVSGFFIGTPRRGGFGFISGYGRGHVGSLLYLRGRH